MDNVLVEAIDLLKRLPEKGVEKALEYMKELKKECEKEKKSNVPPCPHCNGKNVVRNGHKKGKQAYLCHSCEKSFVETTKNVMCNSHYGEAVWKQVIRDTVNGVPIDDTADSLDLHHETVFNMRHKILCCLEQEEAANPTKLEGVCEADETYVLESYKGKKFDSDFRRRPRKHGAVAENRGLSNEYICICAGIEREGAALSMAVNRAKAGSADISRVLGERVSSKTLILSDGAKSYGVLGEKCTVQNAEQEEGSFFHINTVNGYHSFIKERNRNARGFATKYLNRYNALFSKVYRTTKEVADDIYNVLCDMNNRYNTASQSQTRNLLEI